MLFAMTWRKGGVARLQYRSWYRYRCRRRIRDVRIFWQNQSTFCGRLTFAASGQTAYLRREKSDLEERMADALYPQIYFSNGGF